jgi:dihydroorotate dehydrogenase electron transfer subunit
LPIASGVRVFAIAEQIDETPTIRTVHMEGRFDAIPGQFVMVWVPGVDEFPMSVSHIGERFGVTYKVLGAGTKALSALDPGEKIGIRGPYGRGFAVRGERMLAVAGGTGMACLAPMVEQACRDGVSVDIVLGARTKSEILMRDRCNRAGATVHVTTDDGSEGTKGFATDGARVLLKTGGYDEVLTCGPERMIVGVLEASRAHGVPLQASLERHMKCGIGICDSCAIDGRHVCVDGPVFSDEQLLAFSDLGKMKLGPSGARIPVD